MSKRTCRTEEVEYDDYEFTLDCQDVRFARQDARLMEELNHLSALGELTPWQADRLVELSWWEAAREEYA